VEDADGVAAAVKTDAAAAGAGVAFVVDGSAEARSAGSGLADACRVAADVELADVALVGLGLGVEPGWTAEGAGRDGAAVASRLEGKRDDGAGAGAAASDVAFGAAAVWRAAAAEGAADVAANPDPLGVAGWDAAV